MDELYKIPLKLIDGTETDLSRYENSLLLIVNTASKCGFTKQYKGLEALYQKYKDKGFIVLGFPCNQFGGQEPGTEKEIQSFCEVNFGVSFLLFAKIAVNGKNAHPLYVLLKSRAPGVLGTEAIKWNFTKFLIAPKASLIKRFASSDTPDSLEKEIEALL